MNEQKENVVTKCGRPKDTRFPKFVTCGVTGKQFKINVTQLSKQLEKSGQSIEDYVNQFVSREGRRVLVQNNDPTEVLPPVDEQLGKEIETVLEDAVDDTHAPTRIDLIKTVWEKVCQHPPEYYQAKFKLQRQHEAIRN